MTIAFDAYYAFHFKTGVAHYSRNLINSLAKHFPGHRFLLFTDVATDLYWPEFGNVEVKAAGLEVPFFEWVHSPVLSQMITENDFDIFHGLDHALPSCLQTPSVVTIHDLFFESHPQLYGSDAVNYYCVEARSAAIAADKVIAISAYTKEDVRQRYSVADAKIEVVYQTCNPLFFSQSDAARQKEIEVQFQLPEKFWLYVGSITERKNLLQIGKAMHQIRKEVKIPLVVIGEGGAYLDEVRTYISKSGMEDAVQFISYTEAAKHSSSFQTAADVPFFYRRAFALLYPSLLEGFGIPLVEAFASGIPVITSNTGSLPEIGGDAALYVDPTNVSSIAGAMSALATDARLHTTLVNAGRRRLSNFHPEKFASHQISVYKTLCHSIS